MLTCKCGNPFTAYSSIEKYCYECRIKKLKEKEDVKRTKKVDCVRNGCGKDNAALSKREVPKRTDYFSRRREDASKSSGDTKNTSKESDPYDPSIRDTRGKAKGKKHGISNKSKAQAKKDSVISSLKAERIKRHGPICEHCEDETDLQYSHLIPKSIRPDLYLDPDNGCNACNICHASWESLGDIERVKRFLNLESILEYLEKTDVKRWMHVTLKLKINL